MRLPKGCNNSIWLYKIIYFATSWNFPAWLVNSENMYKKIQEIYKNSGDFGGPFLRTVFYYLFSCGHDGIRPNHVKIKYGQNFKAKHRHAH